MQQARGRGRHRSGGGDALLRATEIFKKVKSANDDHKTCVEIVRKTIQTPVRQIATNAGENGEVVVGKIPRRINIGTASTRIGEYGNLVTKGIIDPTQDRACGDPECGFGRVPSDL
jgi:chaperonin GroEL